MANRHYVILVGYSTNFTAHIDLRKRKRRSIDGTGRARRDIVSALRNPHGILLMRETMKLIHQLLKNLYLGDIVNLLVVDILRWRRLSFRSRSYLNFWDSNPRININGKCSLFKAGVKREIRTYLEKSELNFGELRNFGKVNFF